MYSLYSHFDYENVGRSRLSCMHVLLGIGSLVYYDYDDELSMYDGV